MNFFKYLTKTSISLAIFLLIGGVALGCGGDDDDDVTPGQGGQSNVGSGGTSAANAGSNNGAAGSTAAAGCVTTKTCGSETCEVSAESKALNTSAFGLACLSACCTTEDKCGAQLTGQGLGAGMLGGGTCVALKQEGTQNSSCPPSIETNEDAGTTQATGPFAQIMAIFDYKGCCRPDGKCGLDIAKLGLGCVANENVKDITPAFASVGPKAQTCSK